MALTFNQKLRILRENEPALYEAVHRLYNASLFESDDIDNIPDQEVEHQNDTVREVTTKSNDQMMDKIHNLVGTNVDKKVGTDIYKTALDNNVDTATAIPEQEPMVYGSDDGDDDIFNDIIEEPSDDSEEYTEGEEDSGEPDEITEEVDAIFGDLNDPEKNPFIKKDEKIPESTPVDEVDDSQLFNDF